MNIMREKFDRTEHQIRVMEFMKLAKQMVPIYPIIPDEKTRYLRAKLILEEAIETIEALGFILDNNELKHDPSGPDDLSVIADGCADISVVTIGCLLSCGIRDKLLLEMVDRNNLDKFGPGHKIREDGKLIKPPNHCPPDINAEIMRQIKEYGDMK